MNMHLNPTIEQSLSEIAAELKIVSSATAYITEAIKKTMAEDHVHDEKRREAREREERIRTLMDRVECADYTLILKVAKKVTFKNKENELPQRFRIAEAIADGGYDKDLIVVELTVDDYYGGDREGKRMETSSSMLRKLIAQKVLVEDRPEA